MSSGCGDVLSLEDLKTAKKHQVFEAEVITGKAGGVAGGEDIDYATDAVTGQSQKTLPAILRDIGFRPANFTFTTGGTLAVGDSDVAVLWPTADGGDGNYYLWRGSYPKVVPAASSPSTTGGISSSAWFPAGDITLRGDLAANTGAALVGTSTGQTVQARFAADEARTTSLESWRNSLPGPEGAVGDGVTNNNTVLQTAITAGKNIYLPNGSYLISSLSVLTSPLIDGSGTFLFNGNSLPASRVIKSNLTLNIPAVFSNPNQALGYLQNRSFADGVTVTIKIADGNYSGWGETTPNHPQGNRINLTGNASNRDAVKVTVDTSNSKCFLRLVAGCSFGTVNGLTVIGSHWVSYGVWQESATPYGCAILVDGPGSIFIGPQFFSSKMYYGLRADKGGSITAAAGCLVDQAGDVAYHAYNGGHIDATGCFATNVAHTSVGLGWGALAEFGGTVKYDTSDAALCYLAGIGAISNGVVWAIDSSSHDNQGSGYLAANGGHIICLSNLLTVTSHNNGRHGVRAEYGSSIEAQKVNSFNNALDGFSANGGKINLSGGFSTGNAGAGYAGRYQSTFFGSLATNSGNTAASSVDSTSIYNANGSL